MDLPGRAHDTGSGCRHDHLVGFYETEAFLVDTVCSFLTPTLRDGDVAIVVATAVHRQLFEAALGGAGIDVGAAIDDGRYLPFDAETVLARFMVDGRPDPTRFHATIGPLLARAGEGGRRVHVYGEMVAVLLEGGDGASALALEDLWNDLAEIHPFVLLCAYPMRAFEDEATTAVFTRICEQHGTVIPSEGYSLLVDPRERLRAIAQLQQQVAVLGPEVDAAAGAGAGPAGRRARPFRWPAGPGGGAAGRGRGATGRGRGAAGRSGRAAGRGGRAAGPRRRPAGPGRGAPGPGRGAPGRGVRAVGGVGQAGIATGPLDHRSMARREAASDRRRASQDRRAAARERVQAESDRGTALADRGAGAIERTHAELDRDTAQSDRGASARERADSSRDDLTGAYHRGAGFVELEREIARARRGEQPLVLAFIDVDGLKRVNDSFGHAAGDRLLVEVVVCIRAALRSYDLVIRYGGDEFICAISGLTSAAATERLALVNHALADAPEHGSVTVGMADLQPVDTIEALVARADAALYRQRQRPERQCVSEPMLR